MFQATLDRAPDSTGYNNWSGQLASGETNLLEVIEGFVLVLAVVVAATGVLRV